MLRLITALTSVALSQAPASVQDRVIDSSKVEQFALRGPLDDRTLEYALGRLATAVSAPFGLELRPAPVLPARVSPRRSDELTPLDLGGQTLRQGIIEVLRLAPGYRWSESHGVVNVFADRPAGGLTFLDEPIRALDLEGVTARQAIEALHRIFDPGYPVGPAALPGGFSLLTGADDDPQEIHRRRAEWDSRLVSVHVRAGTVRDVLNQVVSSHGAAAWVVDYGHSAPRYAAVQIRLLLGHGQKGTITEVPFRARTRTR